ncbi:MAG: hypothetical protein HOE11_01105 [Candidatus Diapherotrites archaeon]|jgi:Txe/YoeB family toxin of Txe-Axe toxin-antitoxin module|nr:hypothetical protein [Candidatus Diapherotrites archaeon]MBT4597144.1 hypothetical protein [Candidatus Diapherotrites archaeon]
MLKKKLEVTFIDLKLQSVFDKLALGNYNEKKLNKSILDAINELKLDPKRFIKIQKKKWPKEYIQKFKITNLWKYDLPHGFRLIYTIKENEVEIISIILGWFSHKKYERKFGY